MQLNGNLTLNANGASEVQNFIVERLSTAPSVSANEKGRIYFNTTDAIYYYNTGTIWQAFATGGSATTLSNEITALESSIGPLVNSSGVWISNGQSFSNITNPTSLTNALYQLDQTISTDDNFSALKDVSLTSLTTGQVPQYNGTLWVNHTLVLADISNVTATYSEVNQLHSSGVVTADLVKLHAVTSSATDLNVVSGTTVTPTVFNYLTNVTSDIQNQFDNKQALDANLTGLSLGHVGAPSANDVAVATGTNTGTLSGFSWQTGAGFRSTQGLVIGTDIQAWSLNLDQLAAFTTAADTSETTTINAISTTHTGLNKILVGSGTAIAGDYWTEVSGAAARAKLGLGDIAILDEASFIRADGAGSSNVAVDINFNDNKITGLKPGTAGTDAINLNQLQSAIAGLTWKNAVHAATTANIALTGTQTIDGVILSDGDRVLVKNQTTTSANGIYVVADGAWALATDFNSAAEANGAAVYVEDGTTQGGSGFTVTSDVTTFGTDPVLWTQFNGASGITAGTGLQKAGNVLSVQLGAGIAELPLSEVGIDLYSLSGGIILTTDGSTRSTNAAAQLHLLLDDTTIYGQLVQSSAGLKITTNTIGKYEIMAEIAGSGLTGGNGNALSIVTAAGTGATGGDITTNWAGVGTLDITTNAVGVLLGNTATSAAPGNHTHKAAAISYDNSGSPITGTPTTVQAAINDIQLEIVGINSTAGDLATQVTTFEASVGGIVSGTGAWSNPFGTTPYLTTNPGTIVGAIETLANAVSTQVSNISTAVNNMYFLFTASTAGTSWTITHSLGQKFCNVTIVDATDNVIIPQSIVFTDANNLTVTFNTAVAGKAVIMGLNPSAVF